MKSLLQKPIMDPVRCQSTVLLADDEPGVRLVLSHVLQRLGCEVIMAEDGEQAVEKFATNRCGIGTVLLDVQMPRLNGVYAMERIREMVPDVRVILTSGMPRRMIVEQWSPTPPWTFLPKPFDFAQIGALFRKGASVN